MQVPKYGFFNVKSNMEFSQYKEMINKYLYSQRGITKLLEKESLVLFFPLNGNKNNQVKLEKTTFSFLFQFYFSGVLEATCLSFFPKHNTFSQNSGLVLFLLFRKKEKLPKSSLLNKKKAVKTLLFT